MRDAGREPVERAADERVTRIGPFGDRGEHETGFGRRRQILRRVHREVGTTVEHGLLDLLHEHAGSTELVDLDIATLVAAGRHDDELRRAAEQRDHPLRLPTASSATAARP